MKQRINLYNPNQPKQAFEPLSFKGSMSIVATVIVVFLVIGLGLTFYANYQQANLKRLQSEKKDLDAEVVTQQARFATRKPQAELIAEEQRLRGEITSRQQLKKLLYRIQPSHGTSFSSYLHALAEASQSESWLTQFQLDNTQHSFVAQGGATGGPAVPIMLESIARTEIFQGMSIGELDLMADESGVVFKVTAELRAYE